MIFALKGQIAWSENSDEIRTSEDSYLVIDDTKCAGVFKHLPEEYKNIAVRDCGTCLIIPGMTDLHTHASQYAIRGTGMDTELLQWLKTYTFPEEARFSELSYADKEYSLFADEMRRGWTTRACIFATLHTASVNELMDLMEETGLISCVGRVNMDRDGGENLCEESAEKGLEDTEEWIEMCLERKYTRVYPIVTPRFIPSCSDALMEGLSKLAEKYNLRMQSHLSENPEEVKLVHELVPSSRSYTDAYDQFGTLRNEKYPSIMAHCVYTDDEEIETLKKHGTWIAHCPGSNMNLASGIAPAAKYLRKGVHIGLGTDVGAGESLSMPHQMVQALQVSNLYTRLVDHDVKPLTFAQAFYMATAGGGSYFGKTGSFKPAYDADILVIDDTAAAYDRHTDIEQRLERAVYLDSECRMVSKYVAGRRIL